MITLALILLSAATPEYPLWSSPEPVPAAVVLESLPGVAFHVIQSYAPEQDGFAWLHGVALAWHGGRLYATFGRNRGAENTEGEEAQYRVSEDGGATWGPVMGIDDGGEPDLAISHGVLLSHAGRLWAFHGAFYGSMTRVHTRAYAFDEAARTWEELGIVIEDGFWPMHTPQRLPDGRLIMAGIRVANGYGGTDDPAAVALCDGKDLTRWELVVIPKAPKLVMWGESAVLVGASEIINIARFSEPRALVAESRDGGRTWSASVLSNLPMAASKPDAGVLSNGRPWLIGAIAADNGNSRAPLSIAVGPPGGHTFSRLFRIRDAVQAGPGESGESCALSYPCAIEHAGALYVGYSNDGGRGANHNSAELAVIPLTALDAR